MKKVLKIGGIILLVVYAAMAITLTLFLLKYNDYNITEINGNSFVIVRDDDLKPDFNKGDLVVVKKNDNKDIKIGDKIFFYEIENEKVTVNLGNVINKEVVNDKETTFVMDGEYPISSEYVIGKASTSKSYAKLGSVLNVLESRYGFLFIIIFPIPLAFTGGFLALYLTDKPVSVIAMIGFVMLAGIIVNNGIVFIDYTNQLRQEGKPKIEALVETGRTRMRPILMTALTTILAMSTMALGFGDGSDMVQPMAIVTIGGMIYGTCLTLFVVPAIYDIFNRKEIIQTEEAFDEL